MINDLELKQEKIKNGETVDKKIKDAQKSLEVPDSTAKEVYPKA